MGGGGGGVVTLLWRNLTNTNQPGDHGKHQQWYILLIVCTPDMMWWKWYFATLGFLPKPHNPNVSMKEKSDKFHEKRASCKWPDQYSLKSEREKQIPYANTYIGNLKKEKKVLMNLGAGQE